MSRVSLVSPTTATAVRTRGRRGERCANRPRGTHRRERARRRARCVISVETREGERDVSVRGGGGAWWTSEGMVASEAARARGGGGEGDDGARGGEDGARGATRG